MINKKFLEDIDRIECGKCGDNTFNTIYMNSKKGYYYEFCGTDIGEVCMESISIDYLLIQILNDMNDHMKKYGHMNYYTYKFYKDEIACVLERFNVHDYDYDDFYKFDGKEFTLCFTTN